MSKEAISQEAASGEARSRPAAGTIAAGGGLQGKVCLVTGAAGGIGRAIAVELARRGAQAVAVCDLNDFGAGETARLVAAAGVDSDCFHCDIAEEREVQALMGAVVDRFGGLSVLVNNAAIVDTQITDRTRMDELASEVWDRVFAVNVKGAFLCIKHAAPYLSRAEHSAIVNCGSVSSFLAFEGESCYCASKAAIVALTRSAALDFRAQGIRCNCYCPGNTDTEMLANQIAAAADSETIRRKLEGMHLTPTPRLAQPEEIARAVAFLASEDASFINGAAIRVDGGLTSWRDFNLLPG